MIAGGKGKTVLIAGGCFWCVDADAEKLTGVIDAVSGYAGGETENPTYENYAEGGHREVVEISYDPEKTDYRDVVRKLIKRIDPTDANGSFNDRGKHYSPAVYYENEEERQIVKEIIGQIDEEGVYDRPLAVEILPRPRFWPAEEYHQSFAEKNPAHYEAYRSASGRDDFVRRHWGDAMES